VRVALDTHVLAYAEGVGDERRVTLSRRILAEIPQERIVAPRAKPLCFRLIKSRC
jgi:hypothetical protein